MHKRLAGLLGVMALVGCGGSGSGGGGTHDGGLDASAGSGGVSGTGTGGDGGSGGVAGGTGGVGGGSGGVSGDAGVGGSAGAGGTAGDGGTPTPTLAGTEFWAVDLPMSRGPDAAWDKPWHLLVHNPGSAAANVTVERNDAAPGATPAPTKVSDTNVLAGQSLTITMPTREVSGMTSSTADPPGPPYTLLSSNAFHVTSTAPILLYQQNGDDAANGGTALLPATELGTKHHVLGWPTTNPTAPISIPGIPDHSSVTIVGTAAGTSVTVTAGGAMLGNGTISAKKAGEQLSLQLGPFDVLNLSSDGGTGDLTGTIVEASAPVAVFSSGERITVPYAGFAPPAPTFAGHDPNDTCCTDHFELQIPPNGALGQSYAIAKSPLRSGSSFVEPDFVRVVGTSAGTTVSTSLPAPFDSFTVSAGEVHDIWATTSFTLTSSAPLLVGQLLASKNFTTQDTGDPSMFLVTDSPAFQKHFGFQADATWTTSTLVVIAPSTSGLQLDGAALPSSCSSSALGASYQRVECAVTAGSHILDSSVPVGAYLYGYGATASIVLPLSGT